MQGRLEGKVALVTGAGNGIGRGCALMFASHGARVIGVDLDAAALAETVARGQANGLAIDSLPPVDLTGEAAVNAMVEVAAARHGGIDILVNAAATAVFAWIQDLTFADWRKTLAAELDSVFLVTRAVWPHMIARGGGSIINFASANAHGALEGSPALAHCAGKGGVLAMTRQLAMEGAPHGIRANTISPGMIVSAATSSHLKQPGFKEAVLAESMIKRLGQPTDIGWCATFLASDESSYITAADFAVDGGSTAW